MLMPMMLQAPAALLSGDPRYGDLLAARTQMALSLGFHILFAVAGIAMPLFLVIAEWRYQRGQKMGQADPVYLTLARRWARGTAILFAVGAVSGTVLSFELGLLWPGFMRFAGAIIGMPFSLEGFAFFTEAIFLGIYLYGWRRVSPRSHLLSGVVVAISGAASGAFVVIANAWMNTPTGFTLLNGRLHDLDPVAAMANPSALPEALHMILSAYAAVGFAVAGIHAMGLLRSERSRFHRHALVISLWVGGVAAIVQPFSGDFLAQEVARHQPLKLAAMESHFHTRTDAPLTLFGWPDVAARRTRYALEIPFGLSLLSAHDPHARVVGLDDFDQSLWPSVPAVHLSFQVMVAMGGLMMGLAALAALFGWKSWRARQPFWPPRWLLWSLVVCAPSGLVAIEAGWLVTELGRQPWIVYGVLRTAQAVTPMPALWAPLLCFSLLYLLLSVVVVYLLWAQVISAPAQDHLAEAEAHGEDEHAHA
jgi:cytochrome d ubiquinol oxidase subunit I